MESKETPERIFDSSPSGERIFDSSPSGKKRISTPFPGYALNFGVTIRVFMAAVVLRFNVNKVLLIKEGKGDEFQFPGGKYEPSKDNDLKDTLLRELDEEFLSNYSSPSINLLKDFITKEVESRKLEMFIGGGNYYKQFVTFKGYQSFNLYVVIDISEQLYNLISKDLKEMEDDSNIIFYEGNLDKFKTEMEAKEKIIRIRDFLVLDDVLRIKVPKNKF